MPPSTRGVDAPVVVGSAWGWWLQRRDAAAGAHEAEGAAAKGQAPVPSPPPVLYTHALVGIVPAGGAGDGELAPCLARQEAGWWYAGSTLAEVLADARPRGETLAFFPSYTGITLGGWLAGGSHSGTTRGGIADVLEAACVLDLDAVADGASPSTTVAAASPRAPPAAPVQRVGARDLPALLRRAGGARYVVVAIKPVLVPDAPLAARARPMRTDADAAWWLGRDHALRVVFAGARGAVGMTWSPMSEQEAQAPTPARALPGPCCGRLRRWLRVDVVAALRPGTAFGACAAACCCLPCGADRGAAALAKGLGGVERRGDANGYVPFLWPSLVLFPVLWRATNAEFFVHRRMTPASLRALLDRFVAFHAEHGGRLELRYKEDSQRLYLDFSLAGDARYAAACRVLRDELGLREWTMHPSKAQLSEAVQRGEA